ncbi:nitrate reductase [Geomonas silvestris]|uniref:Nitrate reductase n=1 Tax=Geomonas silvestris TaxID=2740184 RepID=A0A6V8MPI4_9BACT|nr:molybdopterin-dependent oxidoreductase [Geomonas silvestris]GFO61901.1 nitrate reductase [Geomonas silvestris]
MKFSRRTFLKASGAAGCSLAAYAALPEKFLLWAEEQGMLKASYVPTFCEICFWKCGAMAKVLNGRVVKLEGNPAHPGARGKLCARGNGGAGLLYDPNRLKTPLIRTGARGEQKYRKATWDEALDLIASKLKRIKAESGPESVALFTHGTPTDHFLPLLFAYGSPNVGMPSFAQCRGPRDVGLELTFGEGIGSPERVDLTRSKVLVLFGSHLGENMHNSQVQDFADALAAGSKLIVVDPRFSIAAGKAHSWLPIRPATDLALMLAWIHVIIKEQLYDKAYLDSYATGFAELAEAVSDCTPEWAAKETDLSAESIVETARLLGHNAPNVCIHPGRHATWYGDDVQRSRAIGILAALLGSWGREGGYFLATRSSLPKLEGKPFPEPVKAPLNLGNFPFAGAEGVTQEIRRATLTGEPYPIKGWIVTGTNLMKAMPNQKETVEAINKLDLLVVVDVMPTDTAMMADVILPECTYLERHDALAVGKGRSLSISLRQPALQPLYDSKPGWWIAKQIANRLDLGDYFPWQTLEEKIQAQCALWGVNYQELKKVGTITIPDSANPYITADAPAEFKTGSGKIELYSKELKEKGFDPVPRYTRHPGPRPGEFRLVYGRSPVHTFSRTANNPELHELYPENEVWINSGKAKELGVKNGEYVVLVNQDGVRSNRIKAKVTQRIRTDCVYVVHGFGAASKGLSRAFAKGADDQGMITRYAVDPICGSTGMHVNFVRVEKEGVHA